MELGSQEGRSGCWRMLGGIPGRVALLGRIIRIDLTDIEQLLEGGLILSSYWREEREEPHMYLGGERFRQREWQVKGSAVGVC